MLPKVTAKNSNELDLGIFNYSMFNDFMVTMAKIKARFQHIVLKITAEVTSLLVEIYFLSCIGSHIPMLMFVRLVVCLLAQLENHTGNRRQFLYIRVHGSLLVGVIFFKLLDLFFNVLDCCKILHIISKSRIDVT